MFIHMMLIPLLKQCVKFSVNLVFQITFAVTEVENFYLNISHNFSIL